MKRPLHGSLLLSLALLGCSGGPPPSAPTPRAAVTPAPEPSPPAPVASTAPTSAATAAPAPSAEPVAMPADTPPPTRPPPFTVVLEDGRYTPRVLQLDDGALVMVDARAYFVAADGTVTADTALPRAVKQSHPLERGQWGFNIDSATGSVKDARIAAISTDRSGSAEYRDFVRRGGAWAAVPSKARAYGIVSSSDDEVRLKSGAVVAIGQDPPGDCPKGEHRARVAADTAPDGTVYALGTACSADPNAEAPWVLETWKKGGAKKEMAPIPGAGKRQARRKASVSAFDEGRVWIEISFVEQGNTDTELLARLDEKGWTNVTPPSHSGAIRYYEGGRSAFTRNDKAFLRLRASETTWTPIPGVAAGDTVLSITGADGTIWATTKTRLFVLDPTKDAWEEARLPVTADEAPIEAGSLRFVGAIGKNIYMLEGRSKNRNAVLVSGAHTSISTDPKEDAR